MISKELRLSNLFLGIIVVLMLGVTAYQLRSVLLPFIFALFLSYIFKPIVFFLRRKHVPSPLALLIVFVIISGLFFGLFTIVYSSIESFVSEAPKYQDKLSLMLRESALLLDEIAARFSIKPDTVNLSDLVDVSSMTSIITYGAGSFIEGMGNTFLVLLLMFFILAGSGELIAKVRYAIDEKRSAALSSIMESIDLRVRQYLIAKTLISLMAGLLTTVILLLFGVDFALLWGFLAFLLNFIPNIGSILSVFFPFTISLLQYGDFSTSILIMVLLVAMHMVVGNVLEPKVMQFSLDLSPLLVLASLIFWGWMWGVWGMILAVPMMSILKIVFEYIEPLRPIGIIMSGKLPTAAE
jgi:AI-2 transport protein TqsA